MNTPAWASRTILRFLDCFYVYIIIIYLDPKATHVNYIIILTSTKNQQFSRTHTSSYSVAVHRPALIELIKG